ncbi:MAG: twin-arginine translocase TatA/TatE family subunit [Candidatus Altiarchaeota archaeon]|nr:twin-arginine translocase TatA/TatE family subunit [Candidatus Altiarchaeota archaeon]
MAFGTQELLLVLFIVLLLFGASKLPQLARALGLSVGEFKKGVRESEGGQEKAG